MLNTYKDKINMTTAVSTAEIWAKVAAEQSAALVVAKKALVQATANAAAAARNFNTSQQALANAYATGASPAQIAALNANTAALANQQIVANSQVNNAAQTVQTTQASLTEANQKVAANTQAEQTSIDQPAGPVTPVPAAITEDAPLPTVENPAPAATAPNLAQIAATTDQAAQDKKLPEEPNLAQIAATTDQAAQDKKLPDEPNLAQIAATTDQAAQDKKLPDEPAVSTAQQLLNDTGKIELENATNYGLTKAKENTNSQATQQDISAFAAKEDWRVRLSLSPGATYLYRATPPGILEPLVATDGVIFPYTPAVSVNYIANYDPTELTHNNYKYFTYRGSAVDTVTITCDFTAQDTFEANYLLAVIHFFRSVTKMFYGQDPGPKPGTPPPLCYLSGLGAFQFDAHPLAITGFTYALPTDVDYIRAGGSSSLAGASQESGVAKLKPGGNASVQRMSGNNGIGPGAIAAPPVFATTTAGKTPTYVPTKISITITAAPIVTRNDISNKFSLKEYATGALLRGTQRAGGGIW